VGQSGPKPPNVCNGSKTDLRRLSPKWVESGPKFPLASDEWPQPGRVGYHCGVDRKASYGCTNYLNSHRRADGASSGVPHRHVYVAFWYSGWIVSATQLDRVRERGRI
jgi:hypothetical protein